MLSVILANTTAANPQTSFVYEGKKYPTWGNPNGAMSTHTYDIGKFNRYARLGKTINEKKKELRDIIKNDPMSTDGRLAYACLLMLTYGIRTGNDDSAGGYESGIEENAGDIVHTYGVTTLENRHVTEKKNALVLSFLGKRQVKQNIKITIPLLVSTGKKYKKGRWPNERWLDIDYPSLFKFTKKVFGKPFVPKDLRTFVANTTAWDAMQEVATDIKTHTASEANELIKRIVDIVAKRLGNTPAIAKRNYIDIRMLDWFKTNVTKEG